MRTRVSLDEVLSCIAYIQPLLSLVQLAESMQIQAELAPDMTTALEQAVARTEAGDVILVFGSFNAIEQSLWLRSNDDA